MPIVVTFKQSSDPWMIWEQAHHCLNDSIIDNKTNQKAQTPMHIKLNRTAVRLSGDDRVTFLQNFCTADIKLMNVGEIREAFVLNTKGKLVGHVLVFCHQDFLELNTVPQQGNGLIEHLDRYLIREDVEMAEVELNFVFCFGETSSWDGLDAIDDDQFRQRDDLRIARCEVAGPGYLVSSEDGESLVQSVNRHDSVEATEAQLAFHRVQFGTPWFGADSDSGTLPQELCRDEKSISFTKGCYLGQETVARIDALGRVNKLLVRVQSNLPLQVGQALFQGDKEVGAISSVASDGQTHIGLAMVRRAAAETGTQLNEDSSSIVVV